MSAPTLLRDAVRDVVVALPAPAAAREVTLDDITAGLAAELDGRAPALLASLRAFISRAGVGDAPAQALADMVADLSARCEECSASLPLWGPDPVLVDGLTTCGLPDCVSAVRTSVDEAARQAACGQCFPREFALRTVRGERVPFDTSVAQCPTCSPACEGGEPR